MLPQYGQFTIPIIPWNGKCFRQNGHRQKIKKYINPMQVIITPAIDNSGTTISVKSVVVKSNSPTTINVLPIIFLFFIFLNHPLINMCRKFRANRINWRNRFTFKSSNFYTSHIWSSCSIWVRVCFYSINITVIPTRSRGYCTITLNNIRFYRTTRICKGRILIANSSRTFSRNIS